MLLQFFPYFSPPHPTTPPPRKGHSYELSTHIHVSQLDNNCLIKLSCMSVVPAYMDKAGRQRGWESLSLISVSVACLEIPTREEETDGRVVGSPATPSLTSRNTVSLSLSLAVCLLGLITLITAAPGSGGGRWCLKIRNWGLLPRQDFSAFLFSASHSSSFFCVFFFIFQRLIGFWQQCGNIWKTPNDY